MWRWLGWEGGGGGGLRQAAGKDEESRGVPTGASVHERVKQTGQTLYNPL